MATYSALPRTLGYRCQLANPNSNPDPNPDPHPNPIPIPNPHPNPHLTLTLQVPADCWIEVGGERRAWKEGKLLLMDTSQQHATHNGHPNPNPKQNSNPNLNPMFTDTSQPHATHNG